MNELMTTEQVAMRYGVSKQTIRRLVADHRFPKAIAVGRQLRWRLADLSKWDEQQTQCEDIPRISV